MNHLQLLGFDLAPFLTAGRLFSLVRVVGLIFLGIPLL